MSILGPYDVDDWKLMLILKNNFKKKHLYATETAWVKEKKLYLQIIHK